MFEGAVVKIETSEVMRVGASVGECITIADFAELFSTLLARIEGLLVLAFDTESLGSCLGRSEVFIHLRTVSLGDVFCGRLGGVVVFEVVMVLALEDLLEAVLPISVVAPHDQ
jgi:hypothetical protein